MRELAKGKTQKAIGSQGLVEGCGGIVGEAMQSLGTIYGFIHQLFFIICWCVKRLGFLPTRATAFSKLFPFTYIHFYSVGGSFSPSSTGLFITTTNY
jgi:hypothetical protein